MRGVIASRLIGLISIVLAASASLFAQQPDPFRWIDFHSQKDQDVIVWVTRSLDPEKWTAIREIGVQYDAALVVTTQRATPQSLPGADAFTVWNVSLVNHGITPLIKGVNLRWLDWLLLAQGHPRELGALYENCSDCPADMYFTAFHYDIPQHTWAPRWMRGTQAVPVWSANPPPGVAWTQVYALLAEPDGRQFMGTWNHFDYGKEKDPEDFVYRYDLDPFTNLERTQLVSGKPTDAMKERLCRAQDTIPGQARGQDSALCQQLVMPRVERKPVTTPPANNHGKSVPPGSRR